MNRRSSRKARRAIADAQQAPKPPATPEPRTEPSGPSSRRSRRGEADKKPVRRGSSRGRRRSTGAAEGTEGRRPPIGRDGKATIGCPNCGARFKIAEENLEVKAKCSQCYRTFFPLVAAQNRRPAPDNSKPIIYGIIAVVAIFIVGALINTMSKPVENVPTETGEKKAPPPLGNGTTEVSAIKKWAQAMGDADNMNAAYYSDMDALQKKFGIDKKNPHHRSFGEAQTELGKKILAAAFTSDEAIVFRAYKPAYGRIMDAKMVEDKRGTVLLSMAPRDSKVHKETAEVLISYKWDEFSDPPHPRVKGWKVQTMARADMLIEKVDKKTPAGKPKKHESHELIGKTEKKTTKFGGQSHEIEEAKLVALPHLETTSPEDRAKIDDLVNQMVDLNGSGAMFNRASNALEKFGKAAVPRVLNKMYETKMKTDDDVTVVNRCCRFLRNLTGERFGFNPANQKEGSDIGGTEKERISAVKQWFAWWSKYHDRADWTNMDNDEEIELTKEQKEARDKERAEQARRTRMERRKKARGGK